MHLRFKDRTEAGKLLAQKLLAYKGKNTVVLGLPRGGVVLAKEIASLLECSLDLLFAHKIGHPLQEEYAIAAISESGYMVGNEGELALVDAKWLEEEKKKVLSKMQMQRTLYLKGRKPTDLKNKTIILVDDGVATGLTFFAAVEEAKHLDPPKLLIAVPIIPQMTAQRLSEKVDALVALCIEPNTHFLGSVGAYYDLFPQISDATVIQLLKD